VRVAKGSGRYEKGHHYVNAPEPVALFILGGEKMKRARLVIIGLLVALLVAVPAVADAHWGFGGGRFWALELAY
jgi:hypothetical protein